MKVDNLAWAKTQKEIRAGDHALMVVRHEADGAMVPGWVHILSVENGRFHGGVTCPDEECGGRPQRPHTAMIDGPVSLLMPITPKQYEDGLILAGAWWLMRECATYKMHGLYVPESYGLDLFMQVNCSLGAYFDTGQDGIARATQHDVARGVVFDVEVVQR